ncbi:MAG TPA: AarF/UbiB family protein [Fibrobacteria bacterium]|nr:AarF/UbiB family protein [Fibrobacteria bacterium]
MLSQEEELLPEEFRKELSKSCYQSPAMNRGLVHLAVTREGRRLAVKLQYPGIARTVKNDLAVVGGFASHLPWLKEMQGAWTEVAERMLEELSYAHEARWTEWFRANLGIREVTIPAVHPGLSTETVLTTDFMDGVHLPEWLAGSPGREERDALAAVLWKVYLKSVYVLNALNADPNPGNFLIRPDRFHPDHPNGIRGEGAVAMLDFGCVKTFPAGFSGNLRRLFAMHARGCKSGGSVHSLVEEYDALGILRITDRREDFSGLEKHLRSMGEWVLRPYRTATFDFGAAMGNEWEARP